MVGVVEKITNVPKLSVQQTVELEEYALNQRFVLVLEITFATDLIHAPSAKPTLIFRQRAQSASQVMKGLIV